jgi:5'-3' exonuclease
MGITIIDGNNLAFRSWKSMDTNTLTNGGDNVSVIYGFLKSLNYLLRETFIPNDMVVIVWDIGKSHHRLSLYPEYKANRAVKDEGFQDFIDQTDKLKDVLRALPFYQLQLKGYEGDDLIAAVCKLFDKTDKVIISADKDLAQLVDAHTSMYKLGMLQKDHKLIKLENFEDISSKCKIPFNKILDYKVLSGDPSDNIKGVNGIGDKSIERMFEKFGSLSEALDQPDELMKDNKLKKIMDTLITTNESGGEEVNYPNLDIITRNYRLMDITSFITDELLIHVGETMLTTPLFNDQLFKKYLMEHNFQSYLTRYDSFVQPFIKMKGGVTYENNPFLRYTLS